MSDERVQFSACSHVPQFDCVVGTTTRHCWPVRTSHSLIEESSPPLAKVCPSELNTTEVTAAECPLSVRNSRPVATSQILIVVSAPPLANSRPSALKATE